jgi:iron(III) transport system permease protein
VTVTARTLPGWAAITAVAAAMAAPVAVVAWSLTDPDTAIWQQLWRTRLPGMLRDTVTLSVAVLAGTLVLGTALAWLVTAYEFRGRRVLGWLLVTPLAVPGYVLGFVWLDTLADPLGARGVRSIWVCAAVLTLTLYPYVYLFARAAFRDQTQAAVAAARSLGASRRRTFWRVVLPAARPSLAAGAALVAMEVLTDIGTVRLFNVSTVADGVLRVWFGSGDRDAATELAMVLVVAAVGLIALERGLRGGARYTQLGARRGPHTRPLRGAGAVAALAGVTIVLGAAVLMPVARLIGWATEAYRDGTTQTVAGGLGHHLANTLQVAALATVACVGLGTGLALAARRRGRAGAALARVASLGYAVPGPVVAIGVVVTLAALVGLVYGLAVRFLAVGYQGVDAGLAAVPAHAVDSARTLGARPWRVALRVELPQARAALLAAAALVAVDTVKELPITLLLRPFGTDTLSVWVWQATSESLWVQAALPSLAIVAVGMVPVAALLWALERGARVTS